MALDKSQTSIVAKMIIAFVGFALIIGLAGPSLSGLFGCATTAPTAGTSGTILETISAQYRPVADSWEGLLASDPDSATILVTLGNLHSDWSVAVVEAIQTQGAPAGSEIEIANLAISYYQRAVAAGATDPGVRVDLAITHYYAGDVNSAVLVAEEVMGEFADFAPAYYNAGIFYGDAGRSADALEAFRTYLTLDPTGVSGNREYAEGKVAELEPLVGNASEITTP